jgi:hypothetical protein
MARADKQLRKMRENPRDWRIEEFKALPTAGALSGCMTAAATLSSAALTASI